MRVEHISAPAGITTGRQELEKLRAGSITLAAAVNNETNGISNLSGNHETEAHSSARHVSNLVDNGGMHGFIVTVKGGNAGFNCHVGENGRCFTIVGKR